jgi:5-methylcytosine-specific restriction endonuclease McrA
MTYNELNDEEKLERLDRVRRARNRTANYKKRVLKRDVTCRMCPSLRKVVVHHIKKLADYPELEKDELNMIVLCKKHHHVVHHAKHEDQEFWENLLAMINSVHTMKE